MTESLFSFDHAVFRYEPYPIGLVKSIFSDGIYRQMLDNWPDIERFRYMPDLGHKYSLSEVNNGREYRAFVKENPLWNQIYNEVKSETFIHRVIDFLAAHEIDLDLAENAIVTNRFSPRLLRRFSEIVRGAALKGRRTVPLRSRFEFSLLPGDGGSIRPHTDAPKKYITLVASIVDQDEWMPDYGGGTAIVWPKDARRSFNQKNGYLEFDEVDVLDSFEFQPNQCVVFVKTFNSWHAVRPIATPSKDMFRRSLTINIEAPGGW